MSLIELLFGKKQKSDYGDISNAQVILQKVDGLVQFYVQGGSYSMPTLGNNYYRSSTYTDKTFGNIPVAFVKLAPTDNFSIQAGKLPTLIGTEYAFTFQNTNIERGLIWNQENIISRGVQANYSSGPIAVSAALTDGFYTQDYKYLTALATYTINDSNSISIAAGGNPSGTKLKDIDNKFAVYDNTVALANSQQYNLYYKNVNGSWTFQPILLLNKILFLVPYLYLSQTLVSGAKSTWYSGMPSEIPYLVASFTDFSVQMPVAIKSALGPLEAKGIKFIGIAAFIPIAPLDGMPLPPRTLGPINEPPW